MVSKEISRRAGPHRRDLLKAGTLMMGGAFLPFHSAKGAAEPEKWTQFRENARDFLSASIRRGLTGSWDQPKPVRLGILPPASEAEIAEVERRIGEPLPKALRRFYADCTAGVDIYWLMPGQMKTTPEGLTTVEFDQNTLPPPPFQERSAAWIDGGARLEPKILGGHISFSLHNVPDMVADVRASASGFRKEASDDPESELHFRRYAEWWERGFPLGLDGGGNMIAIDRQDEEGRMMWLAHDGADEPGWFLEHDLLGFMLVQSRLGFPGFGGIEFGHFSDPDVQPGDREVRYLQERPGDAEAGLAPPSTYRIDDQSNDAKIWRDWLGLKKE